MQPNRQNRKQRILNKKPFKKKLSHLIDTQVFISDSVDGLPHLHIKMATILLLKKLYYTRNKQLSGLFCLRKIEKI